MLPEAALEKNILSAGRGGLRAICQARGAAQPGVSSILVSGSAEAEQYTDRLETLGFGPQFKVRSVYTAHTGLVPSTEY